MITLLDWLYANVLGNVVASVLCGIALWFWKIRPHVKLTREIHAKLHRDE